MVVLTSAAVVVVADIDVGLLVDVLLVGLRRFASSESIYAILRCQSVFLTITTPPPLSEQRIAGETYICLSTPSALIPVCVTNRFPPIDSPPIGSPCSSCSSNCSLRTTTAPSPSSSSAASLSSAPRGLEARNSTPPLRCLRAARRRRIAAVEGASSSSPLGGCGKGSAEGVVVSLVG